MLLVLVAFLLRGKLLLSFDSFGNYRLDHSACFVTSVFHSHCSAKLVDLALASGKIYDGEGFNYIKECFDKGTLHLIGLLSDGGVHSRLDQVQVC